MRWRRSSCGSVGRIPPHLTRLKCRKRPHVSPAPAALEAEVPAAATERQRARLPSVCAHQQKERQRAHDAGIADEVAGGRHRCPALQVLVQLASRGGQSHRVHPPLFEGAISCVRLAGSRRTRPASMVAILHGPRSQSSTRTAGARAAGAARSPADGRRAAAQAASACISLLSSAEITKINADNWQITKIVFNEKAVRRFSFAVNDGQMMV